MPDLVPDYRRLVVKVLLIVAGLSLTNHFVVERVLYFWSWRLWFPFLTFACIWLAALLAVFYLAFTPARQARMVWVPLVALSTFAGDLFFRITGDRLSLGAIEAMEVGYLAPGEITGLVFFYAPNILAALLATGVLCAGVVIDVRPFSTLASRRLMLLPLAPYLLLVALVVLIAGNRTAENLGMPQQFHPASVLTVLLLSHDAAPAKSPVEIRRTSRARARHIVLIVDESVRGDYIDLGATDGTTPYLASKAPEIIDFGLSVSGSNCSNGSNAILRLGASPESLGSADRGLLSHPSIWKYARAAGFRTSFLDGQGIAAHGYDYLNSEERALIDTVLTPPRDLEATDTDLFLAERLAAVLGRRDPQFVVVNKRGVHFAYQNTYPAAESVFEPAMSGLDSATDPIRLVNTYKNAIRWNVDGFFRRLLESVGLDETVVIYTSDHGQNLLEDGTPVTHCRRLSPILQEAVVPMLVLTSIEDLGEDFKRGARLNRNRTSGFQVFPTLLTLMGFAEKSVQNRYYQDLFTVQDVPLGFTSGPIAGAHKRPAIWNSREGLKNFLDAGGP